MMLHRVKLLIVILTLLVSGCGRSEPVTTEIAVEKTPQPGLAATEARTSSVPAVTASPTAEEIPSTATPSASTEQANAAAGALTRMEGLPVDEFFAESYKQLLLRNPEALTVNGLYKEYGLRNDRLNDLSDDYLHQTQALESGILELLRKYDRNSLTPEQQVTYDVYEWYLDDLVRGHPFAYHNYPVHHFLGSYDTELIRLFTELHLLESRQDAEDYISRLWQVDDQVDQLLEGLNLRATMGVVPPKFIIKMTLPNLYKIAKGRPTATPFYEIFNEKLDGVSKLNPEEKMAFRDEAKTAIQEAVIPAFQSLATYFEALQMIATDDAGVWKLQDGQAYYAWALRHQTSTDLSAEEIHNLGLAEVERIQAEMGQAFADLGFPGDQDRQTLMQRVAQESGFYNTQTPDGQKQMIGDIEALLDDMSLRLEDVVDLKPAVPLQVVGDPNGGGFYVQGTLDGSRPGAFHAFIGSSQQPKYNKAAVAYHEAIPGHHFQIAIAQGLDMPLLRNDIFFNGYVEGWALYAEQLAWELGAYEDNPYGNLARLDLELLRSVRLVVDTGIHAKGWTRQQAQTYMDSILGNSYEVDRYVVWPAQAVGYKVGMLKILQLRQRAQSGLGDRFDLKDFHRVVLGNGAVPLDVLERLVETYMQ